MESNDGIRTYNFAKHDLRIIHDDNISRLSAFSYKILSSEKLFFYFLVDFKNSNWVLKIRTIKCFMGNSSSFWNWILCYFSTFYPKIDWFYIEHFANKLGVHDEFARIISLFMMNVWWLLCLKYTTVLFINVWHFKVSKLGYITLRFHHERVRGEIILVKFIACIFFLKIRFFISIEKVL